MNGFDEELLDLAEAWTCQKLGSLDCQILRLPPQEDGATARQSGKHALVFMHGSGEAWGVERRSIFTAEHMHRLSKMLGGPATIVLPASPMLVNDDARHRIWYSSDAAVISKLLKEAQSKEPQSKAAQSKESTTLPSSGKSATVGKIEALEMLKDGEPMALEISRALVLGLLEALESEFHVPCERVVLAGFSQGAAVAMDAAVHMLPRLVAGIGFFSGSLMCRRRWRARVEAAGEEVRESWRQIPVLQAHGTGDWSVGVNGGRWLHSFCKDDLRMQKAQYFEFKGGHTIPPDLVEKLIFELFAGMSVVTELPSVATELPARSEVIQEGK